MNMNEPKLRFKADDGSQFPDWEEKKLSDIFVERREMQCIDDEYKLLSFTIEQGVINPEDKKTNKRDFLMKDKARKKFLRTEYNDIIYNPANLKYGAINRNKLGKGLLSPIYAIFYTEQNAVFMESVVRNPDFIKRSLKYLEGTVIKLMTLKPRDFLRMKSYIPCLEEQQKIAEFLSTVDTVIEKQKEIVLAWEERKKGVMQKLFSQEVRFRADDGSDFPEWENVTVLDLLVQQITDGPHETPVLEENGVSFVSVESIDNGRVNLTKRRGFISKEYDDVCAKKYKPQLYDVYMVKSGATTGKVAIVTITDDFNIWSPLAAMRTSSKTEAFFLYYQLQSDMIQNQVWTKLSLGNQPNLGMRALELFSAVRPCFVEQQKIVDCLSSLDEVIEKQEATLAAWEEMKKGLLQQMFV